MTRSSSMILPFCFGAAAGAVLALLYAPRPGAETRARLARVLTGSSPSNGAFAAAAESLREPH